jgi:hypothetical protein
MTDDILLIILIIPNTHSPSSSTAKMIARGTSFVSLLLLFSGAVLLPLEVLCTSSSSSALLYQDHDASATTTTTTALAGAVHVPAAVTEQRQQPPRSLLLRGGGDGEDASGTARTDQEHRRRRATIIARGMQEIVVEPIIPIILIVCCCLCCCFYCLNQQQEQQEKDRVRASAGTSAVQPMMIQSSTASRIMPKHELFALPPRLVTAAATKFAPESRCGVDFVGTDYAQITRILSDSIFAGTDLEPGMKIVSINNIPIHSTQQAVATLRAALDLVTIVAHSAGYYGSTDDLVTATIVKDRPDQPMGISYKREVGHGPVVLGMFPATSLLLRSSNPSSSDVTSGMEVIAVNNIPVRSNVQAAEVTRLAYPLVTILARQRMAAVAVFAEPVAPSATTEGGMVVVVVEAEPVTSYTMSSRDDPIVATAVANPVASYIMSSPRDDPIVNNNDSVQQG